MRFDNSLFIKFPALVYLLLAATGVHGATYEAESATLTGVTVASSASGYSGSGYVTGFDATDDKVVFTVPSSSKALYDLSVRYRAANGDKKATLLLNGAASGEISFTSGTSWTSVAAGKVLLNAGSNTIGIQNNWGYYEIDSITVNLASTPPPHQATAGPINPNASSQARSLLKYVQSLYGSKMLSGQQELQYANWVTTNVGKTPAIIGLDLIDYSPSRVERGSTSTQVEDAFTWDTKGGIVTFCWHWNAPSGLIDTTGKEWWRGFYTDSVTFDVSAALANKNGADYALLIRDIDAIAVQLKRLEDRNIPILWRPLHESGSGGWFWWSAKGPGPVIELWKIMYDRLTNYHKIDNLIWVWNSPEPAYYPGDSYVDIIAYDSYPTAGDHGPVSATYDTLVSIVKDKKPVALGEVGTIPDSALLDIYNADWVWFVTWGGSFITDGQSNSLSFLKTLYNSAYVITLDEVGNFKNFNGGTTTPTTSSTSTTSTPSSSPTSGQVAPYGQCGGQGYTGSTQCTSGWKCVYSNAWYSQCLPA